MHNYSLHLNLGVCMRTGYCIFYDIIYPQLGSVDVGLLLLIPVGRLDGLLVLSVLVPICITVKVEYILSEQ